MNKQITIRKTPALLIGIFLTFFIILLSLTSCLGHNQNTTTSIEKKQNKILLLKVDYTTNTFEEGAELTFGDAATHEFTIETKYNPPRDFGGIQLFYKEKNQKIFEGSIVWMGLGTISYPDTFLPANHFEVAKTEDYILPGGGFELEKGFENVFNTDNQKYDYQPIWGSVQNLIKTREYLSSNPNATVKIFLYTPSVGTGDPKEWDWIMILKN